MWTCYGARLPASSLPVGDLVTIPFAITHRTTLWCSSKFKLELHPLSSVPGRTRMWPKSERNRWHADNKAIRGAGLAAAEEFGAGSTLLGVLHVPVGSKT